ncbi:MAG: two-component system response regulator [Candidatus Hydrothermarchaeota archaeon]|nr:MAG: two-component system response regulator [Candidatus Hydrothermarchaeota archaeon]
MKVMVVDDEEEIIELVENMLGAEGIEVVGALSGKECLKKIKREKPDFIFLDIMMPEMDGWETLNKIKEDEELKDIPVAMFTVKPLTSNVLRREEIEKIVDYVTKPFSKEDLLEVIRQVIDF